MKLAFVCFGNEKALKFEYNSYGMECQPTLESASFEVVVNGEKRTVPRDQTVIGLVRDLGLEPERVAVELDRRIVRRAEWPETQLQEGARLEIVQFVGGG